MASYGPPPAPLVLTSCTEHSASVAGTLTPLPGAPLPGGLCEPPPFCGIEVAKALRPFTTSAAGATFTLPPPAKHVPQLLPGLVPPSPLLGACDAPCESKRYVRARGRGPPGGYGGKGGGKGGFGGHGGGGRDLGYRRLEGDRAPVDEQAVLDAIARRAAARQAREFQAADQIRAQLLAGGVEVDDRTKTWCVRDARLAAGPVSPPPGYYSPSSASPSSPPHPYAGRSPPHPGGGGGGGRENTHVRFGGEGGRHDRGGGGAGGGGPGPVRHGRSDGRHQPYARPPPGPPPGYGGGGVGGAASLLRQQLGMSRPQPPHNPYQHQAPPPYQHHAPPPYPSHAPPPYQHHPPPYQHLPRPPPGAPPPYQHGGGGGGPPPRPRQGGSSDANRSAADLLRQQLMRR